MITLERPPSLRTGRRAPAAPVTRTSGKPRTRIALDKILIEDRRRENTNGLDDLAASIRGLGLLRPIVIDPEHRLISGYRRLAATRRNGARSIPFAVARTRREAALLILAEREDPLCAVPMTAAELVSLVACAAGSARGQRDMPFDEAVTAICGMSRPQYVRIQALVAALGGSDAAARRAALVALGQVDRILAGEAVDTPGYRPTITGVYRTFLAAKNPAAATVRRTPVRAQRHALNCAMASLGGLASALATIDTIDSAVSPTEADAWAQELATVQKVLRNLATKLKEHSRAA